MKLPKKSIKKQYSLIFSILLIGTIVFISFLNIIALGRYYMFNKKSVLLDTYKKLDAVNIDGMDSVTLRNEINSIASVNNIEVLILTSDKQTVITTEGDEKQLTQRLLEYIFVGTENVRQMYQDDRVQIQMTGSRHEGELEYLELWGVISANDLVIMRTPVQSMREAAVIANKMFIVVGAIILVVGTVIIWFVSGSLSKPIMNLVKISEKITHLDFSEKYECGKGNEIDELGEHINQLSENLEKTIMELKAANIKLQADFDHETKINEMRKEFVSNVSHELKTPIALIQGYAEGLKDCVNDDADSRDFYCEVIVDEAIKMNKIVRNLLNLAEIEAGNNISVDHFDIIEMITNCIDSMEMISKQKNVDIRFEQKRNPVYVWSDEFKIEQVINNYLSNAYNHVDDNGRITINVVNINDNVRVSIFNSGEPIPEDQLDKLWIKFYKVDKARTREYGGSGIGLSIVKAIMELLGHDYGVVNHEDGVEFWFEVDANQPSFLTE